MFTDDAAKRAPRCVLRAKLSQTNAGVDQESMQAGITLPATRSRKAPTFSGFPKAMVADLGDMVRPYLKSWYLAVKHDPRASEFAPAMEGAPAVESADIQAPVDFDTLGCNRSRGDCKRGGR